MKQFLVSLTMLMIVLWCLLFAAFCAGAFGHLLVKAFEFGWEVW